MTRIVKEPVVRRNEILDVTERLIATKGYEQMAIRDIMDQLQIAKGTVYHYFDSKQALLFALVERKGEEVEGLVLPIIQDPQLGALDKFVRFFSALDQHKRDNKPLVFAFMRVWYADENAIVRHRLTIDSRKRLVPWLSQIIQQGIAEGVFAVAHPDHVARMIMALIDEAGYAIVEVLLSEEHKPSDLSRIAELVEAMTKVLERVLGAQPDSLRDAWRGDLAQWSELSFETESEGKL